jgi:YHS domain-containing protein
METLLTIALWAGLIFLMMRFGCGAHMMGHGHGNKQTRSGGQTSGDQPRSQELRWLAPPTAVDPVCGDNIATDGAKSSVFAGDVYYFCSRQCREAFEAAPDTYLRGEGRGSDPRLEQSHV